jgi:hypothetical protein
MTTLTTEYLENQTMLGGGTAVAPEIEMTHDGGDLGGFKPAKPKDLAC